MTRRAAVIGIGMIGGSVASALRARGWHVTGDDMNTQRCEQAKELNIIDAIGIDPDAEITFVATPVSSVAQCAIEALARGSIVTDVGSVKGSIVSKISHPRFIGGHPMAGSERSGLEGVNPDLFEGATWVLTPSEHTNPEVYMEVHGIVTSLGPSIITLPADEHDKIVATVSHVPHLASSALMNVASQRSHSYDVLLQLAASGFRDMTRIAAGHPKLWADISIANKEAITDGLGQLIDELSVLQELIANASSADLEKTLAGAAVARKNLPVRAGHPDNMSLVRIPIPDSPGALGEVLGVFGSIGVNVEDLQVAHDIKGDRGTLEVTIDSTAEEKVRVGLNERGFRVAIEALTDGGNR